MRDRKRGEEIPAGLPLLRSGQRRWVTIGAGDGDDGGGGFSGNFFLVLQIVEKLFFFFFFFS
jgi:hypothetical protein